MRTNIIIDDNLMNDAMKLTGITTKREAVELGLKTLIRLKKQESIKKFLNVPAPMIEERDNTWLQIKIIGQIV